MRCLLLALLMAGQGWSATTYYLTVAGLGGEPGYEQRFKGWAQEVEKLLKSGDPDAKFDTLFGPAATKASVERALRQIAQTATAQDTLVVTLIGHGTFDGSDYKLALPGPDLTGVELAALLDRIPAAKQIVVNTTSASGGCLAALHKANRVVITATRNGSEKNATNFARYWVEALRDPAADIDKNEVITAGEAFRYAEQKTKDFFEQQKRLATEHALMDDGAAQVKDIASAGPATRYTVLRIGAIQAAAKDPAKQKLLGKREVIERQIQELLFKKAAMPSDDYKKQMTDALVELAKVQAEIDQ